MRFLLILLLVAGVVLGLRHLPGVWKEYREEARSLEHLSAHLTRHTEMLAHARQIRASEDRETRDHLPLQPVGQVRGKPLLICLATNANVEGDPERFGSPPYVHDLMHQLPEELMPRSERQVGTLIGLTWADRYMGSYGTGVAAATALLETCEIDVIDKETGVRIATVTAIGGHPQSFAGNGDDPEIYGTRADAQVIDYLISLFQSDYQLKSILKRERGEILIIPPKE